MNKKIILATTAFIAGGLCSGAYADVIANKQITDLGKRADSIQTQINAFKTAVNNAKTNTDHQIDSLNKQIPTMVISDINSQLPQYSQQAIPGKVYTKITADPELINQGLKQQYDNALKVKFTPAKDNPNHLGQFIIKSLAVGKNEAGDTALIIEPIANNRDFCYSTTPLPSTTRVTLNMEQNNAKTIAAYLMASMATAKPVTVETITGMDSNSNYWCHIKNIRTL
ncbi:MAG: hypothetical protein ACO2ZM_02100 [Francisellaceae bacterium]